MELSPGQELSSGFYRDIVAPLVPEPHAAALVGEGSEILGFDDDRSTDHSWGPRLHLFVAPRLVGPLTERIDGGLPESYRSCPVRFYAWQDQTVRHHVTVTTVTQWVETELRTSRPITSIATWLSLPQQRLLQMTAGPVFRDDSGVLTRTREDLAYFPDDVWWWLQASQWQLIAGAEPLLGRSHEYGDVRGARLVCSRLAQLVMQLAFLHERRYIPYAKWFAAAFGRLDRAEVLGPLVDALLEASEPDRQEDALRTALEVSGVGHNQVTSAESIDARCRPFEVGINDARRPYQVLNADRFVQACLRQIDDPALRRLAPVGSIDQLTHSGDLLVNFTDWPTAIRQIYRELAAGSEPVA